MKHTMKTKLTTLIIVLTGSFAFGHGEVELGPNKGRIVEFSTDESMHGELTAKNGKLHITLLDKDMKPVKIDAQSIIATGGTREKPVKLEVTKSEAGFTLGAPQNGEWLILQYKGTANAKPVTARVHYDVSNCSTCTNPEWLCTCSAG
jgi:hypothetical protein